MLIQVYQSMPSDEIAQRLAAGDLIPLARGVAENELQQRRARGDTQGAGTVRLRDRITPFGSYAEKFTKNPLMSVAVLVSLCMLTWALLLVMPLLGLLCGFFVAAMVVANIAHAFPRTGILLGVLLIGGAIWLTVDYWVKPGKTGLEGMFIFFGVTIEALALLALGYGCLDVSRKCLASARPDASGSGRSPGT